MYGHYQDRTMPSFSSMTEYQKNQLFPIKDQGDWANSEIQFKYEKLKFHNLFNRSMEIVFHKIQKWGN